jgi:hypothetical protein
MDLLISVIDAHAALVWSAVSGVGALLGTYVLARLRIKGEIAARLLVEREKLRDEVARETTVQEVADRTAFRTSLMAELADVRIAVRVCELDRIRLNELVGQYGAELKMLRAECDIMKLQMKFATDNPIAIGTAG